MAWFLPLGTADCLRSEWRAPMSESCPACCAEVESLAAHWNEAHSWSISEAERQAAIERHRLGTSRAWERRYAQVQAEREEHPRAASSQ